MSNFPPLNTGREALTWAEDTHDMALGNFDNIWPWRWLRWWRQYRLIKARLAHSKAERRRRLGTRP